MVSYTTGGERQYSIGDESTIVFKLRINLDLSHINHNSTEVNDRESKSNTPSPIKTTSTQISFFIPFHAHKGNTIQVMVIVFYCLNLNKIIFQNKTYNKSRR